MTVRVAGSRIAPELRHVQRYSLLVQCDLVALDLKMFPNTGPVQRRQNAAQPGAGLRLVVFGPEHRRQRVAHLALARDGQVEQQRHSLAAAHRQRFSILLNAWRSE